MCAPSNEDEFEEDDQGGGAPDYCDYFPNDACEEDPFPNDNDGTSGGTPPNNDSCPTGQVQAPNNECVNGEKPCAGNPVKNPRIAAQLGASGINGGRWGTTRFTGLSTTADKNHNAIDIKVPNGSAIFSPFDGTVDGRNYQKDLGYYITIRFLKDNVYYLIRFAHLKKESMPLLNSTVTAGQVIGVQGDSGNLANAIIKNYAVSHTHITTLKRTGTGWSHKNDYVSVNPENLLKTKFNSDGSVKSTTDC